MDTRFFIRNLTQDLVVGGKFLPHFSSKSFLEVSHVNGKNCNDNENTTENIICCSAHKISDI